MESYNLFRVLQDLPGVEPSAISSRTNDFESHMRIKVTERSGLSPIQFSLKASINIRKTVEDSGIDVLQVYGGPGGVMMLRNPGVPVVYVANHTYAQQYDYLARRRLYKLLRRFENRGYRHATKIAAISTTTAESLIENYGIAKSKISVIPVGIDKSIFKPLDKSREPKSILFVGRLCARKGLHYLLEAIGIVQKKIPRVKVYIVGEGELLDSLKEVVKELGITENVFFEGKVSEKELVDWYNSVELFVLPSVFEGFGIVCLESLACGTPVIATEVPGVIDIVKDERPCALVPYGNAQKLADAIIRYFTESWCDSAGEGSLLPDGFGWQSIGRDFAELYDQVLRDQ